MSARAVAVALCAILAGPVAAQSSYGGRDSLRMQEVEFGFVLQSAPEAIRQDADGRYTAAGSAVGAAAGAAVGAKSGQGNGYGGAAVGGILGGVLGAGAAELLQRRETPGQNILVKLDSGRNAMVLMPIVDGRMFKPGQRVAMASVNGQNRLLPVESPAVTMPPVQPAVGRNPADAQREILEALAEINRH